MMPPGRRPAVRSAFLASLGNAGFHPVPQDIALEFREHGEHAGEGSPPRGGHVERLRQRHEADSDGMELLECRDQVE
jgi:hypothetical protein